MSEIGIRIRKLREWSGKTAAEMSDAIGVPASTYREWEYGRSVKGEHSVSLARELGVSMIELLTGEKPQQGSDLVRQLDEI